MGKAYFMVRAKLIEAADRPRFDHWYETEHLPDAVAAFEARRGWRCWSRVDPTVHFAFYEFTTAAGAEGVVDSPALRAMVVEFDRVWGARVTRMQEILELAGEVGPAPGTASA
jgi:hypothetical protein